LNLEPINGYEMLKLTKTSIGLDIGSHSIKMVELKLAPKSVFMTNFAVKELPPESSSGVIAENIKALFQEKNIKAQKVTLEISGAQVAIRHIRLPSMPKKELKEAVRWEAGKFISFSPEKAIVEFQLLGEVVEEGVKKLDLMVAAAEGNFIEEQLSVIKEAGLEAAGISTIPHALWHCMQTIPQAKKGVTALIDIGAKKTNISIFKDNKLHFTREIATAGNAFTEAVKEAATLEGAALDFEKAEAFKKSYAIPKHEGVEETKGKVPFQKLSFVMRPVLERLLTEINRSFDFYKSQFKEEVEEEKRIFICGGGAELKGLKEYIEDQLGAKVDLLTPFKDMAPVLATAAGLALGRAKEFNLLPEQYRLTPLVLVKRHLPLALACLLFFVLFAVYLRMDSTCTKYKKQLALKETHLAGLQSFDRKLVQLKENKKRLNQNKALFPVAAPEQPRWIDVFKEISHIIPEKTALTHLILKTKDTVKELHLNGVAFGGDEKIAQSILEIMQALEFSPLFSDVRLSSSAENNEYSMPGASFDLSCKITVQPLSH